MGIRGRKPTPTHLAQLMGNPGHRPVGPDQAPGTLVERIELPECPAFLRSKWNAELKMFEPDPDSAAAAEWERIVPLLSGCGLLATIDYAMLGMYCQAYARWKTAELKIAELAAKDADGAGLVVKTANGFEQFSYWLNVSNKAQEQLRAYASEFGMSPVARTRVRGMLAAGQGALFPENDPMESFLNASAPVARASH
jgi:P27 family predicted phage terminase small subunit